MSGKRLGNKIFFPPLIGLNHEAVTPETLKRHFPEFADARYPMYPRSSAALVSLASRAVCRVRRPIRFQVPASTSRSAIAIRSGVGAERRRETRGDT